MPKLPTADQLNRMIDEAINQLADDRVDSGVDILYELAAMWKSAGSSAQSFSEICQYIEREAGEKSDEAFVHMKITMALRKARENKHGLIVRVH